MGVQARIRLLAADDRTAEAAFARAFDRLEQLEHAMSDYRRDSELTRVNRAAGGEPVPISADLMAVLRRAVAVSRASDGAFDPTAGPLVDLWRTSRRTGRLPDSETLAAARDRVGVDGLQLDPVAGTARLARPGMRLDLGGIGKGWAASAAVDALVAAGTPVCLVSIAGDVAAGDPPPGRRGWRVEAGRDGEREPARLVIARQAVSTSGDSSQFVVIDGVRHAHLVDPRTGLGTTAMRAVTVLADRGGDADAIASAVHLSGTGGWSNVAVRVVELARDGTVERVRVHDPDGSWATATRPER